MAFEAEDENLQNVVENISTAFYRPKMLSLLIWVNEI